ncbi:MAG TPA: hypothetical protein VMM13_04280, partial [Euzebya sp.]|nr:hypothetical protein [Euzebya sp.]
MRDDVVADRAARRRVWLLTLSFVIVAGVVTAIGVPWNLPRHELGIALGIAVLFGATEHWVLGIRLTHRTHSLTLSEFPLMLGLYVLSPMTLLIARLIGVLPVLVLGRHQAPRKFCFNLAAQWLETLVAIAIIVALDPQRALVGPAGFVAVLLMAFGVTVTVAMQLAAVISANAGTFRPRLATSIFSELIGPNLATTAFAVSTLVLILVSPWLLWAPVAIVAVLFVAYRSHLTLVHLNDRQSQLLSFTRTTTGREGVTAAAEQVVQATVELAGVTAVGIATPAADGSLSWLAGNVD